MATQRDVRKIALSLPETFEEENRFSFAVMNKGKPKGIAWVWLERIHPKKARVPNPSVLAVRVAGLGEKEMFLAAQPTKFFTEPHYANYPAILVRLAEVDKGELRQLLVNAWLCVAPTELVRRYREQHGDARR